MEDKEIRRTMREGGQRKIEDKEIRRKRREGGRRNMVDRQRERDRLPGSLEQGSPSLGVMLLSVRKTLTNHTDHQTEKQ